MKGKEFLDIAQKMVQIRSEAAVRSAVSRTYYAVFNTGKDLLNELGFALPKDAAAHEQLYQRLHNCGIIAIADIGDWLRDLRKRRVEADYDMTNREFQSHKTCEFEIVRAKLSIAELENYSQQPLRHQLKDGIQAYEQKIKLH